MKLAQLAARKFIIIVSLALAATVNAQNYQVYFGDLHQHSIFSWDAQSGAKTPAAAYAYAKNVAKIDFMAITDHTNGLSESNYQLVRAASHLYDNPDSQFVAIAGQELGSLGSSGYGHMNIFEPLMRADNISDNDTRYNLQSAYQFLIDNELLAQFNHPTTENGNSNFNDLAYFQPVDLQIKALEVINGRRSSDYEYYYLLALKNGWHLGAVGDQDNHASRYGDNISTAGDIYLTGILADSLTKTHILEAYQDHRTFAFEASPASDRMYLTEFTADDHWMGEQFENDDNAVKFTVSAHAESPFLSAQLYKNGLLIRRFEPRSTDFTWDTSDSASYGEGYYFVKLVQEDGDFLWSSPIWINSPGQYTAPEVEAVAIADLHENIANGLPRRLGETNVTVRGVATAGPQFGSSGPGYIQDDTGGIAVFGSLFVGKVIPAFAFEFEVTGTINTFNGLSQIIPYSVTRLGLKPFPAPRQASTGQLAQDGEQFEGQLVTIVGATITGRFPPTGANANLSIDDGSGSCVMRIDGDTDIAGTAALQGVVNITGIVTQFDGTAPYNSGYQLMPRSLDDFAVASAVATETESGVPEHFELQQNYPNPFNAGTVIPFSVPHKAHVTLEIYTIDGQQVTTLLDQELATGSYEEHWGGMDGNGKAVASGVYFTKMQAGSFTAVRKMIYMR